MTDTRVDERVKVVLNGESPEGRTTEHPLVAHPMAGTPDQALLVLTMAQRTAEEHVTGAHRQADGIRAEAMAAAEQIAREAEAHAQNLRREADKTLMEARGLKERAAHEAQGQVDQARRDADKVVADARAEATTITAGARAEAEDLKAQAQRRYEDIVGSLGAKRAALQEQIEALEQFDREYRTRLLAFMQSQMRALWADRPQVTGEVVEAEPRSVRMLIQGEHLAPAPVPSRHAAPQAAEGPGPGADDAAPQSPGGPLPRGPENPAAQTGDEDEQ
jgi:hypothetical protein